MDVLLLIAFLVIAGVVLYMSTRPEKPPAVRVPPNPRLAPKPISTDKSGYLMSKTREPMEIRNCSFYDNRSRSLKTNMDDDVNNTNLMTAAAIISSSSDSSGSCSSSYDSGSSSGSSGGGGSCD